MSMEYGLSRDNTVIHGDIYTFSSEFQNCISDFFGDNSDFSNELIRGIVDVHVMLFRYNKSVARIDRFDVEKRKHLLVLVDFGAGNVAFDDFTEDAGGHWYSIKYMYTFGKKRPAEIFFGYSRG